MKKKNVLISGILVMTMGMTMACGSKENVGVDPSSTYNTVKIRIDETKNTTVPTPSVMEKDENSTKKKVETTVVPTKNPVIKRTPEPTTEVTPTKKPIKKSVKNIKSMKPILTTIALYMAEGPNYDSKDNDCYYSVMYMLANNVAYSYGKPEYKEKDGVIYIGMKAMESLSAAAFANHSEINKVPNNYGDMMTYNKEKQIYVVYESDTGDVNGKIRSSIDNENGTYTVVFDLLTGDGEESLASYEFSLVENQSINIGSNPTFYYSVKTVKKLTE